MRLALVALLGLIVGGLAAVGLLPDARERLTGPLPSVGKALVGGPFTLVDHNGKTVTDKDFRGRYMLVAFGFTHCPDICPSGLQLMAAAVDALGARSERVTPVFISIDPERDTPAQLAQYVKSFHPRLVGLTGSPAAVDVAVRAYRVYARKVEDAKSTVGFTFDHSSLIYFMGPDGSYLAHFSHATSVDKLVERMGKLL